MTNDLQRAIETTKQFMSVASDVITNHAEIKAFETVLEAAQRVNAMQGALESAENAILQYELALNEAADDYNKISEVCKSHGLMSSYRESVETAAYIRAMLHKHSAALSTIQKAGK